VAFETVELITSILGILRIFVKETDWTSKVKFRALPYGHATVKQMENFSVTCRSVSS